MSASSCARRNRRAPGRPTFTRRQVRELTTDLAWDGQACIYELGDMLSESERFPMGSQMCIADIGLERLRLERMRTGTFNDAATLNLANRTFRRIECDFVVSTEPIDLIRPVARYPFVPADQSRLDQDCYGHSTFRFRV